MTWTSHISKTFLPLRSIDFWLFAVCFFLSGFTLQAIGSVSTQSLWLLIVLIAAVSVSALVKRRSGWKRKTTGSKGMISALVVAAFWGYAIFAFSTHMAKMRDLKVEGNILEKTLAAMSEPMIFGAVMPFSYLFVFAGASYLGLTDIHEVESAA